MRRVDEREKEEKIIGRRKTQREEKEITKRRDKKRVDEEEGKEGEVRGWTKGKKEGRENG